MNAKLDEWMLTNTTEAARLVAEYTAFSRKKVKRTDDDQIRVRVFEYLPSSLDQAAKEAGYRYFAEIIAADGARYVGNPAPDPHDAVDNVHYREVIVPDDPDQW